MNIQQHPTPCSNIQQHPTACNQIQQHPTVFNNIKHHPTTFKGIQQHTTVCNNIQQHATTSNSIEATFSDTQQQATTSSVYWLVSCYLGSASSLSFTTAIVWVGATMRTYNTHLHLFDSKKTNVNFMQQCCTYVHTLCTHTLHICICLTARQQMQTSVPILNTRVWCKPATALAYPMHQCCCPAAHCAAAVEKLWV